MAPSTAKWARSACESWLTATTKPRSTSNSTRVTAACSWPVALPSKCFKCGPLLPHPLIAQLLADHAVDPRLRFDLARRDDLHRAGGDLQHQLATDRRSKL